MGKTLYNRMVYNKSYIGRIGRIALVKNVLYKSCFLLKGPFSGATFCKKGFVKELPSVRVA